MMAIPCAVYKNAKKLDFANGVCQGSSDEIDVRRFASKIFPGEEEIRRNPVERVWKEIREPGFMNEPFAPVSICLTGAFFKISLDKTPVSVLPSRSFPERFHQPA